MADCSPFQKFKKTMEVDEDQFAEAAVDEIEGNPDDDEENEEDFEVIMNLRQKDVWKAAGPKKNEVVRELIKCFGSMVESHVLPFSIPDHNGRYKAEDMQFSKLLDASKYVARAKRSTYLIRANI